ncbi:MAG: hypothetical protein ABIJ09_13270 [Pseudomonadota bacterium]
MMKPRGRFAVRVALMLFAMLGDPATGRAQVTPFAVQLYSANAPPATPGLTDLPLLSSVTQHGITWTFEQPTRVGRFVNGDFYVVGAVTVTAIDPLPTAGNGRHGSMLDILPNLQRSGFDDRETAGRYDETLRVYPPIALTPGHKLVSSRSAASPLPAVMRPGDTSESPVASISILTSVDAPQPPDAFRPSYADTSNTVYLSRQLQRQVLPRLAPVANVPPLSEFEDYLQRPWVDSVFFSFDVPAEYMASYGRENGYVMGFAGLLLTLDFSDAEKEPLLVYLVQYGIDLFGLVQAGHDGWNAHGGHGSGRKFPILLAGTLLQQPAMQQISANFGEDMQTIWVSETLPAGTFSQTWHHPPQLVAYAGHMGLDGESANPGWGPYEHLAPAQWVSNYPGEDYRRCCTSVCWVGQALAARLIPGLMASWSHPQFFAYVDRWMTVTEASEDLAAIEAAWGASYDIDFQQGQAWRILSGGGYYTDWRRFVDEMWAAYRDLTPADAGTPDSSALDSVSADSNTPDSALADRQIVDTSSRDHALLDAAAVDVDQLDGVTGDRTPLDVAVLDSAAIDAALVDAGRSDSVKPTVIASGCACTMGTTSGNAWAGLLAWSAVVVAWRRRGDRADLGLRRGNAGVLHRAEITRRSISGARQA